MEVEVFLIHNSFSKFPNGFRIKLNGFHIYKEQTDFMKKCEKLKSLKDYLNEFREFILLRNDPCDAEQNSYDAVIMLTGRTQNFVDVGEGI